MAFVFVDYKRGKTLVYRDLYGKRSLILQAAASGDLLVSSVLMAPQCEVVCEVQANSLLVYDHESGDVELLPV